MVSVSVDFSSFDFDFWTSNKARVLLLVIDRGVVGDIRSLSLLSGLSYSATYEIVHQLVDRGVLVRDGRSVSVVSGWRSRL